MPSKKRGRPLLLGANLDRQVQAYLYAVCERGGAVNTSLTIAIGTEIAMRDSKFASIHCNDDFELSKDWAKYLMQCMGLVKRRASTKAKVDVADFEKIKKGFLLDVHNVMEMDEIPPDLVINFDQTAVHYVPVDNWTCCFLSVDSIRTSEYRLGCCTYFVKWTYLTSTFKWTGALTLRHGKSSGHHTAP